jgi:hypothetical protein
MEPAVVATSVLLAGLLIFTAYRKLTHRPAVVQSYARVGVPERALNPLAALLLAAAAGLLVGLVVPLIGIVTTIALIGYFAVAIGAHVRFRDLAHIATPIAYWLLAIAVLVLHVAMAR